MKFGPPPFQSRGYAQRSANTDAPIIALGPFQWLRADSVTTRLHFGVTVLESMVGLYGSANFNRTAVYSPGDGQPTFGVGTNGKPYITWVTTAAKWGSVRSASDWNFLLREYTFVSFGQAITGSAGLGVIAATSAVGRRWQLTQGVAPIRSEVFASGLAASVQNWTTVPASLFAQYSRLKPATEANPRNRLRCGANANLDANYTDPALPIGSAPNIASEVGASTTYSAQGRWYEAIWFDRALSDAELTVVSAYGVKRYAQPTGW